MNERFYQEELMDHYRFPRNRGTIANPDFSAEDHNPSCGDQVTICGMLDKETNVVTSMMFTGKGCVLSQAVASMLTELCIGKTTATIAMISAQDIAQRVGIPLGPTRMKCALLPLTVLHEALLPQIA